MADRRRNREPRVNQLLLSDDEATSPDIDPDLVSRLETWFGPLGPPAHETPAEAHGFDDVWLPPESPHQEWRRARALEAASRGPLAASIERRSAAYGAMIEPLPPMELGPDLGIARLDLSVWPNPPARGPRELIRPEDLAEAVAEQVPQAVLRDLNRPEPEVGPIVLERIEIVGETGTRPLEMVRAVIDTRYRIDIKALVDTPGQIRQSMAELRQRIDDEPWADARPAEPAPFPSYDPSELMKWFG